MMKGIILSSTFLMPLQTREIFEQPFQLQLGWSLVLGRQNVLWNFRSHSRGVSFTFQRYEQIWTKQLGAEVYMKISKSEKKKTLPIHILFIDPSCSGYINASDSADNICWIILCVSELYQSCIFKATKMLAQSEFGSQEHLWLRYV